MPPPLVVVVALVGPTVLCGPVFVTDTLVIVLFPLALPAPLLKPGTEIPLKSAGGVPVVTGTFIDVSGKVLMSEVVVAPAWTISWQMATALTPEPEKEQPARAPKLSSAGMAAVSSIAAEPSTRVTARCC